MMLIAASVGAVILYLYVNFLLLPQIRGAVKAYNNAKKIYAEVKASERAVSEVDGLKRQVSQYQNKIESYEKMLPVEQEIPKLLEDLSNMAKESSVKIVGITPLQAKEPQTSEQIYQEIPILINARSGYHELGKFLSDLEGAGRFMKVVDINIKENKATAKRHDVELLVLTYVFLGSR